MTMWVTREHPKIDRIACPRLIRRFVEPGREGRASGEVYAVSVPRDEAIREHGAEVPPAMGVGTVINLQAAGNGRGAITGDFVFTADEVVPVQRALVENSIEVTAIHTHMLH